MKTRKTSPTAQPGGILKSRIHPPTIEALEARIVYSATLSGVPTWIGEGPGPTQGGNNVAGIPNAPQVGAVEQIAVDPSNPAHVFLATVNGGIWRSDNATAASPTWMPMTDLLPSNSFSAIAFDPTDATHHTVWAANGRVSSGGGDGEALLGVWESTDDGVHWTKMGTGAGSASLAGGTYRSVLPTGVLDAGTGKEVIMAANNNGGLFRSIDGGSTFTNVADGAVNHLPAGAVNEVVADPSNNQRYYATVPFKGVFRTTDAGATWTAVNTGLTLATNGLDDNGDGVVDDANEGLAGASRIEASVGAGGSLFAVLMSSVTVTGQGPVTGTRVFAIFHSGDNGGTWAPIGKAPSVSDGAQGGTHLAIVADPTDGDKVYVSGDRGPNGVDGGTNGNAGNLFRGSVTGNNWTELDRGGANGTSPHPDSRDLQFQGGSILQANDGGVYRLVNPNGGGTPQWSSILGNLQDAEFYSVAFDSRNNVIFGGTQDNGSPAQSAVGGSTWIDRTGADGGFSAVDNSVAGQSTHYGSEQGLGAFSRQTFTGPNTAGAQVGITVLINGGNGANLFNVEESVTPGIGLEYGDEGDPDDVSLPTNPTTQFIQPYVLNAVTPTKMLIGTNFLYESNDQGDDLVSLGGLQNLNSNGLDDDNNGVIDDGKEFKPINSLGTTTAMAYGGTLAGVGNADFTLVGTTGSGGNNLFLRTANTTNTLADFAAVAGYTAITGSNPRDIVLDPANDAEFFVLAANSHIYETTDTGAHFTDVTLNLGNFSTDLRTVEFYNGPGDHQILAGGLGGVFHLTLGGTGAQWSQYGVSLPNVLVKDLHYKAPDADAGTTDDVLIAGTWGRGAFEIANVSSTINSPTVLQINGDQDFAGENDTIKLIRDPSNPAILDVFINNNTTTPDKQVPLATLQQINVNGLGGNDTLILDSTNGLISVPNGTHYDGGTGHDAMQLVQTGGSQASDVYSVGSNNGDGSSVITGTTGVQTVQFQNIEPVLDTVPAATLIVNATAAANAINYGPGSVVANGLVTIDNFESIEFSNKTTLTLNGLAGSDEISLHNDSLPTALTAITVDGGDPTGSDKLIVSGTSAADDFTFSPTSLTAGAVTDSAIPGLTYNFLNTEHTVLDGEAGDDTFHLDGSTGAVSLLGGAGKDRVSFANALTEGVVFNLDAIGVDQRINSTEATVTLLDGLEGFTGTKFNDLLYLKATTYARDLNGGLQTTVPPGDKFVFDALGAQSHVVLVDSNTGTIKTAGYADVTFDEFETSALVNTAGSGSGGGFGAPGASDAFSAGAIYGLTQIQPAPAKNLVGKGPTAVAVGDVNGDGFPDLVTADSKSKFISILLGRGDGTFGLPTNILSGGTTPTDIALANMDGVNGLDIVVTNAGTHTVAVLLNNGAGVFGTPLLTPKLKQSPTALAIGDLNGDAIPDVVVADANPGAVTIFLTGAGGVLGAPALVKTKGSGTADVVVGDFTGDGKLDIATANGFSGNVSLLANAGAGVFSIAPQLFTSGVRPTGLAAADFNNDGHLDLAVSHAVSRFVGILIGNGTAATTFRPALHINTPGTHLPKALAAGDFNGDGNIDLAMGPTVGGKLRVILGLGQGDFSQPYEFDLGNQAARVVSNLVVADVNLDGQLDIVTANTSSDDISVLLRKV